MQKFDSELGPVEFNHERLTHIIKFHPEVKSALKYFKKTLHQPDIIRRSKSDPQVLIFYKKMGKDKLLAIVVKTNSKNFILTAYLTYKIKHAQL